MEENEALWEEYQMEDAEICVVAFGIASRVAKNAVAEARKEGLKVGLIRPITLWPFPAAALRRAADQVKAFFICFDLRILEGNGLHHLANGAVGQNHCRHAVLIRQMKALHRQTGHLLHRRRLSGQLRSGRSRRPRCGEPRTR